jgi:hypothetical protein
VPPPIKNPCPQKVSLLKEYVMLLGFHNADLRDYCNHIEVGMNHGDMEVLKRRVEESKKRFEEARKNYTDHLTEHGC